MLQLNAQTLREHFPRFGRIYLCVALLVLEHETLTSPQGSSMHPPANPPPTLRQTPDLFHRFGLLQTLTETDPSDGLVCV